MDDLDEAIVSLLKRDGRLTHREIARNLGASRSAVANRMQRLLSLGEVSVRGVVHPGVIGRGALAYVGLTVDGPAEPVAAACATREDVVFVSMTTGRHAVVVELRTGSTREIDIAVGELRALDKVRGVDTFPYADVLLDVVGPLGDVTQTVDATDIALLRALQEDGRTPYVDLARLVGLSPAATRRRVVRLIDGHIVHVGALLRQSRDDHQLAMGLGVRLAGDHEEVCRALLDMPAVSFLARTLGRFDLLLTLRSFTAGQLTDTLEAVRSLPGVNEVENWTHLRFVKESYASVSLGEL